MGNTEANILRTLSKMPEVTAKTTKEILEAILAVAAQERDNKMVQTMIQYAKAGNALDFEICRTFACKDFVDKLDKYRIPHFAQHDNTTSTVSIVTRSIDREKVQKAKTELLIEQGRITRLDEREFADLNLGKDVQTISNFSYEESRIFLQNAKAEDLTVTVKFVPDKNIARITYAAKDSEKAVKALDATLLSISGKTGSERVECITREIAFQKNLSSAIQANKEPFYVVSRQNPGEYIQFDQVGFKQYRRSRLWRAEDRIHQNFLRNALNTVSGIVDPVRISQAEFAAHQKNLSEYVKSIPTEKSQERQLRDALLSEEKQELRQDLNEGKTLYAVSRFNPLEVTKVDRESIVRMHENEPIKEISRSEIYEKQLILTPEKMKEIDSTAAFAQKLSIPAFAGKTPADVLLENPDNASALMEARRSLNAQLINRPANQMQIEAIDQALSLMEKGQREFEDVTFSEILNHTPNYVILSQEEYELHKEDMAEFIKDQQIGWHAHFANEDRAAALEYDMRHLIEMKMSIEDSNLQTILSELTNKEVSLDEFIDIDKLNDARDIEFINAIKELSDEEKVLLFNYADDVFQKLAVIETVDGHIDPELGGVVHERPFSEDKDEIENITAFDRYESAFDYENSVEVPPSSNLEGDERDIPDEI